jgi:hypothetical protein
VAPEPGRPATLEPTRQLRGVLRLDQTAALFADLRAMIAPLVTFLPGAALTMAVVELSAAEMITGASRLVAGTLRLLLLGFGIVGAAQVVGLPSADARSR